MEKEGMSKRRMFVTQYLVKNARTAVYETWIILMWKSREKNNAVSFTPY